MVVPCVYGATRTIKGRILKPSIMSNGRYLCVNLCKNQKRYPLLVHRIIAQTFPDICGAWFEGCCVNHKDNDGHNNAAYNLEICDYRYNNNYGSHNEKIRVSKTKYRVIQYTKNGDFIREWTNVRDASEELGICRSTIEKVCNNKPHYVTAGGFKWQYA